MTEKSPLERAARAVGQNLYVESNMDIARVVLLAVREPSEAMVAAGGFGAPWPNSYPVWQAMIDAALGE